MNGIICHFSLLCCAQNFSLTSCTKTMAKRMQEQEGENRIVAKSKPTMNLGLTNPPASSSSTYPGGFNPWISNVTEDTSPHVTSERQNPDTTVDPRCQWEDFQRIMGQTNNDCRFQILVLTNSPSVNNVRLLKDKIQD